MADVEITLPDSKQQKPFSEPKELGAGDYGIPISRSYTAVDAILPKNTALQMSVSAQHNYKIKGLKAVKAGLNLSASQVLRVVLVCPPDIFSKGVTWQHLLDGKKRVKKPQGLVDGVGLEQYCLSFDWS